MGPGLRPAVAGAQGAVVLPEPVPIVPSPSEPALLLPEPRFVPDIGGRANSPSEIPVIGPLAETEAARMGVEPEFYLSTDPQRAGEVTLSVGGRRRSFAQKMRRWFRRVA